jgi:anti-sigma-K factor RskA
LNLKEYISSGILELYVLGQLSATERQEVEAMMVKHIEVKQEVFEIGGSLEKYSKIAAVKAPESIKTKLFEQLPKKSIDSTAVDSSQNSFSQLWNPLSGLLLALSLVGFTLYYTSHNKSKELINNYDKQLLACDSIQLASQKNFALLEDIRSKDNEIYKLTATESFAGTEIYLFKNDIKKKNYLQLNNLPTINDQQSYQLWSLKEGEAPIPLTVFDDANEIFVAVDYEDETPTYAITIEPRGGSVSPSLDKLLGTISVI